MRRGLIWLSMFAALMVPILAIAQTVDQRLLGLAIALDDARTGLADPAKQDLANLSQVARALESLITEARDLERVLAQEREGAEAVFFRESQNLTEILSLLAVVENAPAPDFLLHPDGALAAARADLILASVLPGIRQSLSGIADELAAWRTLLAQDVMLRDTAGVALTTLNETRAALLAAERDPENKRETVDPMALDVLYAVSQSLDSFIDGLGRFKLTGQAQSFDFMGQRGQIPYPVGGGPVKKGDGVVIQTDDVLAKSPFPATVRFAAEFLDYGKMVILEPNREVMIIVSGLDELSVHEGDIINAGDVIGLFAAPTADAFSKELAIPVNELYLETRINASPVDSTGYFRLRQGEE